MRFHVIYRAAGEHETTHVEAQDAATAVAAVTEIHRRGPVAFELLSVLPADEANPADDAPSPAAC